MADRPPAGARTSFVKWTIRIVLGLFAAWLCLVLAFYGYYGYQARLQKRDSATEAAALKALFAHDDGRYLYVKERSATLRKEPSASAAALGELGIGRLVYNGEGARTQVRDGYIAVSSSPDGNEHGWIRVDEIAGVFPDLDALLATFAAEKDAVEKLNLAEIMSELEPGNPAAWRPLLAMARQRKDAGMIARASEGLRASEEPMFLVVTGETWGAPVGDTVSGKRPEVGTRLATAGAQPRHYRFQGGNECHIQALGRPERGAGVGIASNRPRWFRPVDMKKLAPERADKYRAALERVLERRDDVPPDIREELMAQLMRAMYRLPGSPYVLVSAVVKVPSEGDQAFFHAHLLLDITAAAPQFVSVFTDWTVDDESPAEAFYVGEKKPVLTFMLRSNGEGGYTYAFYQFNAAKDVWAPAFEAYVPAC